MMRISTRRIGSSLRIFLSLVLLCVCAHRLPAPISEIPESPTPKPEQSVRPKPKRMAQKVESGNSENSTKRQTPSPQPYRTPFNIPQSQMTVSATSQQRDCEASKVIDSNATTWWCTPWSFFTPLAPLPQSITLNLGGTYNVTTLHYLPRQGGELGSANGNIVTYRVYASTDGSSFSLIASGNWTDDHTEKTATFAPTKASYLRLEAIAGHGGWASAAELTVSATQ